MATELVLSNNETLVHEGANLKEAAMVVGMRSSELVNILRKKINQEPLKNG